MKVLVTGVAGFIGMHVAERLLAEGREVVGIDNLNDYYEVSLKHARLARLLDHSRFTFLRCDLADNDAISKLFSGYCISHVVHLGAQAGVRHSLSNPHVYVDSNVRGTLNILEGCRHHPVAHLIFASTSSIYGLNRKLPYSPTDGVDHPVSLYASTKRSGELFCHNYSLLFGVPITALRFFTVYGPWGRPDMSPVIFARKIVAGEPIEVFNGGHHRRDFTFVGDIVESVVRVISKPPVVDVCWDATKPNPCSSSAAFRILNVGHGSPVELLYFIDLLEKALSRTAQKVFLPMQSGDVEDTFADVSDLETLIDYRPKVSIEEGVRFFIDWFCAYEKI